MFFKSDRGVRCAIKSSRSVFLRRHVFYNDYLLRWCYCFGWTSHQGVGNTVCLVRRCVFCDGVFFATVCFLATMCFLRRCVFQRRGLCCEYMVVYFATGTGVVSFGGRMFFATLCFLRRSVGVFCVDQKCFLHRDSVFFASPTNVWDQSRKLPLGPPLLLALASPTCTKIFRQWGLALRTPRGRRCALPHTPSRFFKAHPLHALPLASRAKLLVALL